jgi:hypothetical protein
LGSVVGINLGMITSANINNNWDVRFIPGVSLQQRNIDFVYRDRTDNFKIESAYVELPLLFKFKSDFRDNYRVYILGGFKYSINLVSDKKAESDPELLKIEKTDYSFEFGFGIDIYGDRVKLSPEIRYSLGFKNIHVPESTFEGSAIRQLQSHGITLLLNFE